MTMRKSILFMMLALVVALFTACSNNEDLVNDLEDLPALEVGFDVPETLDVGETLILEAVVTYGGEAVEDADEVVFEVWEKGKQDESDHLDSDNQGDGTYTAEVTFDEDGIYEMYAHTTARDLHTMPKREVVVGEGGDYEDDHDEHGFHTEGFDMHFMDPEDATVDENIELVTHITLNEADLEDLQVRYEIWNDDISENHDWVDAGEEDRKSTRLNSSHVAISYAVFCLK